jgi:hypothetical protein
MLNFIPKRFIAGALVACAALVMATPSTAQHAYPSAEAASEALADAISQNDEAELRRVLGANWRSFVPEGSMGRDDIDAFLAAWKKQHRIVRGVRGESLLEVGEAGWTLPVPLVEKAGRWNFDPAAGALIMRERRVRRNELAAVQAALAYYDAQKEYASRDRDGNGVLEYAQKFVSAPGRHDGLYWADGTPQEQSPLGPLYVTQAPGTGYHGYRFKILKAQGMSAPGGAYRYVIGGRMRSGFALVAWPVRYGDTGLESFIVSHAGVVYQKDLGPGTSKAAAEMEVFNPDASWRKVNVP